MLPRIALRALLDSTNIASAVARVKKIIAADEDIASCSNNGAFVIAVATEMFVQYLVERTHDVVKSERKPRRNIQYRDVANAVARIDNLEFLTDVVPRTQSYKAFKEGQAKRAKEGAAGQSRAPVQGDQPMQDAQPSAAGPAPPSAYSDGPDPRMRSIAGLPPRETPMADVRAPIPGPVATPPIWNVAGHPPLPNGLPQPIAPASSSGTPIAINGHVHHPHHSHSRNHSLEHQNIIHPNPPPPGPAPEAMQIDPPPHPAFVPQHQPMPLPQPGQDAAAQQLRMEALASTAAMAPNGAVPPPIVQAPPPQAPPSNEYRGGFTAVNGQAPR